MTELSFLLDLLLNHKLQKSTRELIAARLKEISDGVPLQAAAVRSVALPAHMAQQAPSMQAIMARNPDLAGHAPTINIAASEPAAPVAVIAQTQAAVAAMNSRQQAINESLAGKVDKNTGRPRKF